MGRRAVGAAALACVALLGPAPARADGPGCGEALARWAAACGARSGTPVHVDHCADGVAMLVVGGRGGPPLRVELRAADRGHGLLTAHGLSLSPVGEFPNWRAAPGPLRAAFDGVAGCLRAGAPTFEAPSGRSRAQEERSSWFSVLAPVLLVAWVALVVVATPRKRRAAELAFGAGAAAFVTAVRLVAIVPAFFHQNGQGATWVGYARCTPSPYGPGYAAVFRGAALAAGAAAERGVFAVQEALAGLAVAGVYVVARRRALSPGISAAVAVALGVQPLASRLAESESYYATIASLLVLAVAALSVGGPRATTRATLVAASLVAGGLVALAATVHPVAWIPAALLPSALLAMRAKRRTRLRDAAIGAGVIAVVVAAAALPSMRAVLAGPLGAQWGGATRTSSRPLSIVVALLLPWAASALTPRPWSRWLVPLAVIAAALLADDATNLFEHTAVAAPAAGPAWRLLFHVAALSAYVSLVAAALGETRRRVPLSARPRVAPIAAALVVAAAGAAGLLTSESALALPTDALEARAVAPWLRALPRGAHVYHLERAGLQMQRLPLFVGCGLRGADVLPVAQDGELPASVAAGDYWLRGSTCATRRGRPRCDAFEHGLVLREVQSARFPARPSLAYLPYDSVEIETVLSRVVALAGR